MNMQMTTDAFKFNLVIEKFNLMFTYLHNWQIAVCLLLCFLLLYTLNNYDHILAG